jgi:23S rRNA (cytidine2498-2'-O)-methyltransferase
MHLIFSADDSEPFLQAELLRSWPQCAPIKVSPGLLRFDAAWPTDSSGWARETFLVFGKQIYSEARPVSGSSISAWGQLLLDQLIGAEVLGGQPWMLEVVPHYGTAGTDHAGENRCRLIIESLREKLKRHQRRVLRTWQTEPRPFTPETSFIQLLLTEPDAGYLAVTRAPRPHKLRSILSPFPRGEVPMAVDKAAPSRAFAKLVEAEQRLGRRIAPGETCVDLGASPGSWTYVALQRGARVMAVDRAPLDDDLMRNPALEFHRGDAFKFTPGTPVDWLLCDVIAAPEKSMDLLCDWVEHRRARHFVVTIKFKGHDDYPTLERLKEMLPRQCDEFFLTRLCANKNEACAFGSVARR